MSDGANSMMVRDFRCNGCGEPLKIPKNSKGHVKCPSCKTECVIQGLVKNAEIAAKENINSGLPFSLPPATLHRLVVKALCENNASPLDVFEKTEIIREERHCVPAYMFTCNATSSYEYEKGVNRTETYTVDRGDRVETRERTHTDWHPAGSNVSITETLFSPGEKKLASEIMKMCRGAGKDIQKDLIDIEELEFPHDVETYDYNYPQAISFSEHVQPVIEELLREKAKNSLTGNVRNFRMGGANIQKEIVRVYLSMYRVVFMYEGKEYDIYTIGNGSWFLWNRPNDEQRQKTIEEKQRNAAAVPANNLVKVIIGLVGCVIGAVISFLIGFNKELLGGWIALGVFVVLGVILGIKIPAVNRAGKERDEQRAAAYKELSDFESLLPNTVQKFKENKKALRGIYEQECTGDSNAFPQ